MNRRDAIKALMALPATTTISAAPVRPSDVIVIECDKPISVDAVRRITENLQSIWPGQKIAVLSDGLKLKIVEGSKVEA